VTRRFAGALALTAMVAVLAPRAAGAAPAPPAPTLPPDVPNRLALVAQDPWTTIGGTFRARLAIAPTASGEQLTLTAHYPVSSRDSFDRQDLGPVLQTLSVPVDPLPVEADGSRDVSVGLSPPNGSGADRLVVPSAGVYPLEVELRDPQEQGVARFVTYLVVVDAGPDGQPQPLTSRLGVAWVWPLVTPPGTRPDGTIDPRVAAGVQTGGTLARQVAALARHPGVPLTVAPSPETLDTWTAVARTDSGAAAAATALRNAVDSGTTQALTGTYVPADLPALLHAGLDSAADTLFVQGGESTDRFFGTHFDQRTVLAAPVDPAAVGRLRSRGVDQIVVDDTSVPRSPRLTTANPFSIDLPTSLAPTGTIAAVVNDTKLADPLAGSAAPALRAQRFLAGLALTAIEAPASERAVIAVNPAGYDAAPSLLEAVLGGLTNNPWLAPLSVDQVFSRVPPASTNDVRALSPYTPPPPAVSDRSYRAAETRLSSFSSLVPAGDPHLVRGEHFLLSSLSSLWFGAGPPQARAQLVAADATVSDFLARIRVPAPGTITLTARSGAIPITFRNDTGQPVRILVGLSSRKLDFPTGALQVVALPPRSVTVRFDVRSRTSGTFPLDLSVRSADGSLLIAQGRFKVRSTVVSTVGLALVIGAAVFLVGWWAYDIRRRRRARVGTAS
jgi:hypothetical protein